MHSGTFNRNQFRVWIVRWICFYSQMFLPFSLILSESSSKSIIGPTYLNLFHQKWLYIQCSCCFATCSKTPYHHCMVIDLWSDHQYSFSLLFSQPRLVHLACSNPLCIDVINRNIELMGNGRDKLRKARLSLSQITEIAILGIFSSVSIAIEAIK